MIDAAHASGATRVIWSGLQSPATVSGGRYPHVNHFEGKWQVTVYGRERFYSTNVAFINVDPGLYASNFVNAEGSVLAPSPKATEHTLSGSRLTLRRKFRFLIWKVTMGCT